jgi:hypothetical protein
MPDPQIRRVELTQKKRQFVAPEHAHVMALNIYVGQEKEAQAVEDMIPHYARGGLVYVGWFPDADGYRVEVTGREKQYHVEFNQASARTPTQATQEFLAGIRHHTLEAVIDILAAKEHLTGRQAEAMKGQLEAFVRSMGRLSVPEPGQHNER